MIQESLYISVAKGEKRKNFMNKKQVVFSIPESLVGRIHQLWIV